MFKPVCCSPRGIKEKLVCSASLVGLATLVFFRLRDVILNVAEEAKGLKIVLKRALPLVKGMLILQLRDR